MQKSSTSLILSLEVTLNPFNRIPHRPACFSERKMKKNCSLHSVKQCFFWWVLKSVYLPLTAIQKCCDSWRRLVSRPRKFFIFCICQVFNANLPLLVTSAFPSSRLPLFSLKRLWSPTDPGDLHRTSLVKCLGWIRRDGWGKEGSSPICTLFTQNPVGKRQHPAV